MDALAGLAGFAALFLLVAVGVPIAFGMAFVGIVGFGLLAGWDQSVNALSIVVYSNTSHFVLACIPLFILMGQFAYRSRIAEDLFEALQNWTGAVPGGLAIATVFAAAGLGAVTGSSVAAVATMGAIALPELRRHGYDPGFAVGTVASAGTLGILIPPSIPMVLYGLLAEVSIGRLFIAGILPGLFTAVLFTVMISLRVRLKPQLAPPGLRVPWSVRFRSLWKVWGVGSIFLLVMGGIFLGWFTPTEGAGIGAVGAFVIVVVTGNLNRALLSESFGESIRLTAMIVAILIGASVFAQFIAITGLTSFLADRVAGLPVNRYGILLVLVLIYLALGCLMDVVGMIVLTIPVFMPVVTRLGFDPIWFGIMVTVLIEVSLITPPVGTNVIIIQRVSGLSSGKVFASVFWFLVVEMVVLLALVLFPMLATWLPERMLG